MADQPPGDYLWSIPLIEQRDLLVGRPGDSATAPTPSPQALGTVLGYSYPTLAPLFARGQLQREDSRSQELALQSCRPGAIGMP
jgi:polar amino acid transport system substrate-binding protein